MMRQLPFYAPLKAPDHPIVSGDRQIAKSLIRLLTDADHGYQAKLASQLRSFEKTGSKGAQDVLVKQAQMEVDRLVKEGQAEGWPLWVSYHNYYKAPDLIGPAVSAALGIPYVLIEASRAAKRATGPWADFEKRAGAASDHAALHFYFTEHDAQALAANHIEGQKLVHLHPFLHESKLPQQTSCKARNKFITVAMMRPGNKLASYLRLAEALALLPESDWTLCIIGGGTEADTVKKAFAPFGDKVVFAGVLERDEVNQALGEHAQFLWPGIDEAFGMGYIEAQARGLPVVAENRSGVREVVHLSCLTEFDNVAAFAAKIECFMRDQAAFETAQLDCRNKVSQHHLLGAARKTIWTELDHLLEMPT